MNITFLIGNGFDLNLKLHTSFQDFLEKYVEEGHEGILPEEIRRDIDRWSDLEMALGKYVQENIHSNDSEFIASKHELDNSLARFLQQENNRTITFEQDAAIEIRDKIVHIEQFLSQKDGNIFKNWKSGVMESIRYCFINFNYTNALDQIISYTRKNMNPFNQHLAGGANYKDELIDPIHIHGTITEDLILGVDNVLQIANNQALSSDNIVYSMVKPTMNESLGNQRIDNAKVFIDNSVYICIFGMSIGKTDLMWWKYIFNWLKGGTVRRLIIFHYTTDGEVPSAGVKIQHMNQIKRDFFTKIEIDREEWEKYESQVIVRINSQIFNFNKVKIQKNKDSTETSEEV